MKILKAILAFIILIVTINCNKLDNNVDKSNKDSINQNLHSTDLEKNRMNYLKTRKYYISQYNEAYAKIRNNPIDEDFFITLRYQVPSTYVETFILGNFYEEPKINEAIILFYLKLYNGFLNSNKYSIRVFSDMGENSYTPIFYTIFLKISGQKPEDGMLPVSVYNWVLNQPKYLENVDIKAEVEKIKLKEKEKEN